MKSPLKHDVGHIAQSLRSAAINEATLKMAADAIRNGVGAELFRALVEQERSACGERGDFIPKVMGHLERIMSESPDVGAYLMGRLYGFAWKTADHAVYNAIELWMHSVTSHEAADALLQLSAESIRPALGKLCYSWAQAIMGKV